MNLRRAWPIVVAALVSLGAEAQTRYVSDELIITFRTGPSSQNAILRNLSSGTEVQILEESPDQGYARVRLADGTEGWVLTQYLQTEPTDSRRLETAERNLATARERLAALETQVATLETDLAAARTALGASEADAAAMRADLTDVRSASANAIALRDENESLRRQVAELTTQADAAAMEISELESASRQNWFIVGAAVLFGGIVIGLVAPSMRPRRKTSW
jgi:SH3 domain protein